MVGVPAAIGLGRFVTSQLYGIKPNDPAIAVTSMAVLMVVAALAGIYSGAAGQQDRSDTGPAV